MLILTVIVNRKVHFSPDIHITSRYCKLNMVSKVIRPTEHNSGNIGLYKQLSAKPVLMAVTIHRFPEHRNAWMYVFERIKHDKSSI